MVDYLKRIGYSVTDLNRLNAIHVAGTKGKGSTSAFCSSILSQKFKTGLFTSPHLLQVRERIRINGIPLEPSVFAKYFFNVWDKLESTKASNAAYPDKPAYFRYLTLMSFHVFLEEKVDCAIMEVGVGGEYDSTNVLPCPVVCGITSLGIDHTALLGDTIDKIAWHKAGIMKPNVPAITVPQPLLAMEVLEKRSKEIGSKLAILKCDDVDQMKAVKLGLAGKHQFTNAALANALCLEWMTTKDVLSNSDLKTGLEAARWPGRCQRLLLAASPHIDWCLDGAHTPESLQICADWFSDICLQDDRPIYLVFNCTHERQGTTLLPPIVAAFQKLNLAGVIFTTNDPFSDPTSSGDLVNKNTCSDPEHSVQKSLSTTWTKIMIESSGKSDIEPLIFGTVQETVKFLESRPQCRVLITGSLHLVGSALTVFGNAVE